MFCPVSAACVKLSCPPSIIPLRHHVVIDVVIDDADYKMSDVFILFRLMWSCARANFAIKTAVHFLGTRVL